MSNNLGKCYKDKSNIDYIYIHLRISGKVSNLYSAICYILLLSITIYNSPHTLLFMYFLLLLGHCFGTWYKYTKNYKISYNTLVLYQNANTTIKKYTNVIYLTHLTLISFWNWLYKFSPVYWSSANESTPYIWTLSW